MKKFSSYIFSIALIFCLFHIRVFAVNTTYSIVESNTCYSFRRSSDSRYMKMKFNNEGRGVIVQNGDSYTAVFVFNSPTMYTSESLDYNPACTVNNYTLNLGGVTNHSGYYGTTFSMKDPSDLDFIVVQRGNFATNIECGYQYTYGELAVEPSPEYGGLKDLGYNTKIAGSGDSAINNLDTITWNPEQDTNGNDISAMSVTIRAVPGKYSAQSSQSILEQLYSNFVLDTLHVSELDTVNASDGSFSVTWNDVVHEFDLLGIPGFWFATKDTVKDPEGGYIKRGWIYQIRLEGEDYTGQWQTVYTATSSGVENDLTIVNSSTINQTLINSITEINNLNNTENNWYINNTTINMGEYSDPGSSGKPWWAYLLEAIVSLLNGVIDAIANLVGSIIDGLLGLFSFDSFSIPDFTVNKQTIKQNSGIFGESIDLLQGINSTLSNADGTADPILYYPGLELMGEEFIPEITINLNTYVSDLGLTEWHNLAYVCTDAMIWISLIYTIYRKLIGVFKK